MEELNIINRHQQQIENNSEPFQTTAQIRNRAQIRGGVAPRSAPGRRKKPSGAGIGGGRPRAKRLQKSYSTEQFCTKNFAYDTECEMERVQLPKLRGSVGSSIKPHEAHSYCLKKKCHARSMFEIVTRIDTRITCWECSTSILTLFLVVLR